MKLAIVIPCCRDWKASFGASLVGLVHNLTLSGMAFDMNIMQGASVLPRARQLGIEWAKGVGASHVLFIDDDMQFSAQAVQSLLRRDLDIVACNYLGKGTGKPLIHGLDGHVLDSSDKTGVEQVGWVGFGMVLIKLEALAGIPKPWFQTVWLEDKQDFLGEDFFFCKKVREFGVSIHVDHDASHLIAHVGDYAYRFPPKFKKIEEAAA